MADSGNLSAAEMRSRRVAALEGKSAGGSASPEGSAPREAETIPADAADAASAPVASDPPLTARSQAEEDFVNCAHVFAEDMIRARCDYIFSMRPVPKPPGAENDRQEADKRTFLTIWSKPTPACPTPPAVVHVKIDIIRKPMGKTGTFNYGVSRYQVEYAKHFKDASVPFEGRWLDEVVRRKLQVRTLINLGDDFLDTRLEEKHIGDPEIPIYIPPTCKCAPPVDHCMKCKSIRRIGDATHRD